jgi:hypothetical protein
MLSEKTSATGFSGKPGMKSYKSLELGMNASLAQIALPIPPVTVGRRGEQMHRPPLQLGEAFQPLARS